MIDISRAVYIQNHYWWWETYKFQNVPIKKTRECLQLKAWSPSLQHTQKLYAGRKIVFCQKLWGKWYIPKYVKSWYIYQLILSDPDECSFQLSWDKINWYMYQGFTYFGICTTFSIIMGPSPKYWTKAPAWIMPLIILFFILDVTTNQCYSACMKQIQ